MICLLETQNREIQRLIQKSARHFATPHPFRATDHFLSSKSHKPLVFARIERRTVSWDLGGGTKEDCDGTSFIRPIFPLTDLESRNSLCRRAIFADHVASSAGAALVPHVGSNFSLPRYEIMTNQTSFLKKSFSHVVGTLCCPRDEINLSTKECCLKA